MSHEADLKTLAKRAYRSYHQDGVIDLLIGWMAFAFGLRLALDAPAVGLLAWLPVLAYLPIKNALTVPRMGYVQFGAEYGARHRKRLGIILAIMLSILVLVIAGLVLVAPGGMAALGENGMLIYGAVITLLLVIGGLLSGIGRLIAYGLLCIVLAIAGALAGLPDYLLFIVLGLIILLVGVFLLARFMRKYPPAGEGMMHGPA